VFTHAYAQAPLTSPSHATILTGTYPQFHQVYDFPDVLAEDLPYARRFYDLVDITTAAFIGSIALDLMGALPVLTVGLTPTTRVSARQRFDKEEDRYRTVERAAVRWWSMLWRG